MGCYIKKVGLPRALIYYKFAELWETFFKELGAEVIISPQTNKIIREKAIRAAPDEDCYSTKLYFGHALTIANDVDYLFIPRFGSKHKTNVGCPKFIGLADVLRSMYPNLPKLIMPYYSKAKSKHGIRKLLQHAISIGLIFTKNPFKIAKAIIKAFSSYKKHYKNLLLSPDTLKKWEQSQIKLIEDEVALTSNEPPLKIALVGHSYVINDSFASFDIRKKLKGHNIDYITSEQMPKKIIEKEMTKLDFNLYFDFEREILGTIMYFLDSKTVDGIIQIMVFGCGPDSIAGEMASRFAKRKPNVQLLQLVIDDLTAEAGFQTRIDAFIDMLQRRRTKNAVHISPLRIT